MPHPIHKVTAFSITGPYRINITFDDGLSREIDFEPVLRGALLGPLRERKLFESVTIDPEVKTLVWPNGADFDPATLHDWPDHVPELIALARTWSAA